MKSKKNYRAFISYSHADEKWASWLHRALETYKVPKHLVGQQTPIGEVPAKLGKVFRDREELASSSSLGTELTNALESSACQIVICSPNAAKSHWTNEEILTYKRLGREDRIFCLIVDGEPGSQHAECFPPALNFKMGDDGELTDIPAEPIAADARPHGDGKPNAKLKLIAGMLGVGFDDLKQRDAQRRQRRLMAITAATTAGMVAAIGLAGYAVIQRNEADAQRQRAQAEAETARRVSDFLVDLFAVSDPSESLGNTVTARELLDQGARRIEVELQDQPAIQSALMDTMGTAYMSLGLYDAARTLLDNGLSTRQKTLGRGHPDVARSKVNLAQLLMRQAELESAEMLFNEAIEVQRSAGDDFGMVLASSLTGLADVKTLQSEFEEGETLLTEAIALQRTSETTQSFELAESLDRLGLNLWDQGRFEEAEQFMRDGLAMRRDLATGGVHPDLSDSLNNLATFLFDNGNYEESEALFRQALDMKRLLLGDSHPEIATGLNNLAFVLHDTGTYEEAEQVYQEALDMRLALLGESHPLVAQSMNNLAFVLYDMEQPDRAIAMSRDALAVYRGAYSADHPELAFGMQNLAGWLVEAGDYKAAEPLLEEALRINETQFDEQHPDVAITQTGYAVLMLKTERPESALKMSDSAHKVLVESYSEDHWRTAWALSNKGASLMKLKRHEEAEPLLLRSYEILKSDTGARQAYVAAAKDYLLDLYQSWGRPEQAAVYSEK